MRPAQVEGLPPAAGRPTATVGWKWGLVLAGVAVLAAGYWRQVGVPGTDADGGILFGCGLLMLGVLVALGGAWFHGLADIGADQILAALATAWCFYRGTLLSAEHLFSMAAIPWHVAGMAGLTYAFGGPWGSRPARPRPVASPPAWLLALTLAVLAGLQAFAVLTLHQLIQVKLSVPDIPTGNLLFYFPRWSDATDLQGAPFNQYGRLFVPVAYALALAGMLRGLLRDDPGERRTLVGLFLAALVGKWVAAYLSTQGLGVIGLKIASINNNYYSLAKALEGKNVWAFICDHQRLQAGLGAHGNAHPFGPILYYWILAKVLGWRPWLHGLFYQVLTALAVPYFYRLGRLVYGSRDAGLAAAFLYLSSPLSLILSGAGVDALILLVLLLMLYELGQAVAQGSVRHAVWAGVWVFLGTLLSYGAASVLAFAGLWVSVMARRRSQSLGRTALLLLKTYGILVVVLVLAHLALRAGTGWHYDYLQGMKGARFNHQNINFFRTYNLWSWANVALYVGYAGVGLVGAWFARSFGAVWLADQEDDFTIPALGFVLFLVLSAMGRAEVERMFLFGGIFLVLPAGRFLCQRQPDGRLRSPWSVLYFAVLLNLACMVLLQVNVLDFW